MKRTLFTVAAILAAMALPAAAAAPAGSKLADEANAKSTNFVLAAPALVSYGAGTSWTERTLDAGPYVCHPSTFGLPAAVASPRKQCRLTLKAGGVPAVVVVPPAVDSVDPVLGAKLSDEHKDFVLDKPTRVAFGVPGAVRVSELTAKSHLCRSHLWGDTDPAPGKLKACYGPTTLPVTAPPVVKPVVETKPEVTPPVAVPDPTPVPAAGNDVATPEAYRARIATLGTDAWIAYKYGTPSTAKNTETAPGPRPSGLMADLSGQHNPLKTFPDGKKGGRGCGVGSGSFCGTFQIGSLIGEPGDYSSNIFNIAYTPDVPPPAGFAEKRYFGVASIQTLNIGHGTVSWKPEPSWTTWINPSMNNGDNDENTVRLAGARSGSPIGTIELDAQPVASARGFGRGGWVTNVLTVYANGAIVPSGSNTSHNFTKAQLPADCKPTAIAITNSGEFALVTCWDPEAFKGKVAVLALADGCQWCDVGTTPDESKWYGNWGNARRAYAGMPGLGNYVGIKFLGYVPLPDSLRAPTDISVTTGHPNLGYWGYQRLQRLWDAPLDTAAGRAFYYSGEARGALARTGMATVISKSEKAVAYLDLRPLFMASREFWTGPQTDAQFAQKVASRGPADAQSPPGFVANSRQIPTVIKVDTLDSRPMVSRMMPEAPHRTLLATEDGKLRLIDLGAGYLDQDAAKAGAPGDIKEIASINVGTNPTSIAHVDEKARRGMNPGDVSRLWGDATPEHFFWWALSRDEQKATMLRLNADATGFSVFRTLKDSRMRDVIFLADGANHGTESYLLSMLDYSARSVMTFSYGPLVMHTYPQSGDFPAPCTKAKPCAPPNGAQFEFTGEHKLPGKPFAGGLANIN